MHFVDKLGVLSARIAKQDRITKTEEAAKHAFVLPFIQLMGYDIFDPTEVTPELIADIGIKKGEKIDYAILKDGDPILLIECKCANATLDSKHESQLHRYFHTTAARFAILTNGIVYKFYTDLEAPNKMDEKPFFEIDVLNMNEASINVLDMFTKDKFNTERLLAMASDLKYTNIIKKFMDEQLTNPSDEFVKLFMSQFYSGSKTQKTIDQFRDITRHAINQFITDRVDIKLRHALKNNNNSTITTSNTNDKSNTEYENNIQKSVAKGVVTTDDELEAFRIVKDILKDVVDPSRLYLRDTLTSCNVLFDNTNRKPICRFKFEQDKRAIVFINAQKEEINITIASLSDIFTHREFLKSCAEHHLVADSQ